MEEESPYRKNKIIIYFATPRTTDATQRKTAECDVWGRMIEGKKKYFHNYNALSRFGSICIKYRLYCYENESFRHIYVGGGVYAQRECINNIEFPVYSPLIMHA